MFQRDGNKLLSCDCGSMNFYIHLDEEGMVEAIECASCSNTETKE